MPWITDCGCTSTSMRSPGKSEQPRRLDQLQALVHHGGAVDADLGAHRPDRVAQRRLRRGARHLLQAWRCGTARRRRSARSSRPRRGCRRPSTGRWRCARNRPAAAWRRASRTARSMTSPAQTSASLLASATAPAAADGGQRRRQAGGAGDRGHGPVGVERGGLDHRLGAARRPRCRCRPARRPGRHGRPGRRSRRSSAPQRDAPARPAARRCGRRPGRRTRNGPGSAAQQIDGLGADAAGAAEDGDGLHRRQSYAASRAAPPAAPPPGRPSARRPAGRAGRHGRGSAGPNPSRRNARFNALSSRSPTCATTPEHGRDAAIGAAAGPPSASAASSADRQRRQQAADRAGPGLARRDRRRQLRPADQPARA